MRKETKMNGGILKFVKDMSSDKVLMCWTGTLYDRRHPNMRCDSVRLLTVHRTAFRVAFRSTAGYRRAAVKDKAELCESDYRYEYDLSKDLRIITGASDRAGRFALPGDLLDWEESQTATDLCLVDADDDLALARLGSNSAADRMDTLFNEYIKDSEVLDLDHIPVPEMVLVASRDARVFSRACVKSPDGPLAVGDKLEYPTSQYYGQGVLAMRPGYPSGHWRVVPADSSIEGRADLRVSMNPQGDEDAK